MGYIIVMEVAKSIAMSEEMAARIQDLADKERRSFSREAQVLLETALERRGQEEGEEG
jgi:predicted transcriptional regulator